MCKGSDGNEYSCDACNGKTCGQCSESEYNCYTYSRKNTLTFINYLGFVANDPNKNISPRKMLGAAKSLRYEFHYYIEYDKCLKDPSKFKSFGLFMMRDRFFRRSEYKITIDRPRKGGIFKGKLLKCSPLI
jgi:hypothetical protein